MANFTPGDWWLGLSVTEGDVILAPVWVGEKLSPKVVATGICNPADTRLFLAAKEMYNLLQEYCNTYPHLNQYGINQRAKAIIKRIDG